MTMATSHRSAGVLSDRSSRKMLPPAERELWEKRAVQAHVEHHARYPDEPFRPGINIDTIAKRKAGDKNEARPPARRICHAGGGSVQWCARAGAGLLARASPKTLHMREALVFRETPL
ncbi:hypothetical protein BC826DRAFT_994942, partial [Russula brevipes]